MRLEHKPNNLDLPELTKRPAAETVTETDGPKAQAPEEQVTVEDLEDDESEEEYEEEEEEEEDEEEQAPKQPNGDIAAHKPVEPLDMDVPDTTQSKTPATNIQQTPIISTNPKLDESNVVTSTTNTTIIDNNNTEDNEQITTATSFEYFKNIDQANSGYSNQMVTELPTQNAAGSPEGKRTHVAFADEVQSIYPVPGEPPEICYTPKSEGTPKTLTIDEKIKLIKESQMKMTNKEPPRGGIHTLSPYVNKNVPLASEIHKHESTITKTVKIDLEHPELILQRPSAEALNMQKLWTPTLDYGMGGEGLRKLPTPTADLSAPYLVQQALRPGTPPEILFAPKCEDTRKSVVETIEKSLEENYIHGGPAKVMPMSVPTLTPKDNSYKPPPPAVPPKLGKRPDFYESDYESDRWNKCSGSESEERPFRSNGYTADTEEMSKSMIEKRAIYGEPPSGPVCYNTSQLQHQLHHLPNGQDKLESIETSERKWQHGDKVGATIEFLVNFC